MDNPPHHENESGIALLLVLLGLIVISVLVLGLVLVTKSGMRESHSDLQASECRAFFDAVILQSGVSLLDTSNPNRARIDGVAQNITLLGQEIPVAITSEFGKVDLNAADAGTLSNLLEAAGEGPAESAQEAAQIVNWRTGGSGTTAIRLFRTVDEITQVPGISVGLYDRIAAALTVYSGRGRVDQSTAPLLALEASGMDRLTAEAAIRDRSSNQNDDQQVGEVVNGQLSPGISITGWAFHIESDYTFDGREEHGDAVIRMTGDPTRPYLMLWLDENPD